MIEGRVYGLVGGRVTTHVQACRAADNEISEKMEMKMRYGAWRTMASKRGGRDEIYNLD